MANITFIVDTGCQFSGISGLIDSFTIANRWHATNTGEWSEPLFTTRILSQDGKAVKVSGGFQVMPEGTFQDFEQTDVVVVPPYLPNADFLPANATPLLDWIVARYEPGRYDCQCLHREFCPCGDRVAEWQTGNHTLVLLKTLQTPLSKGSLGAGQSPHAGQGLDLFRFCFSLLLSGTASDRKFRFFAPCGAMLEVVAGRSKQGKPILLCGF